MAKKIKIKQIEDGLAKVDGSNIPPATYWTNLHAGGLDNYVFHGSDVGSNFESALVIDQGAIFRTNRGGFRTWLDITPKYTIYNPPSGISIVTNLTLNDAGQMISISVKGNSYSGILGIDTQVQFYKYQSGSLYSGGLGLINKAEKFTTAKLYINSFGNVCVWLNKISNFPTITAELINTNGNAEVIAIVNENEPIAPINYLDIPITHVWNSLDADLYQLSGQYHYNFNYLELVNQHLYVGSDVKFNNIVSTSNIFAAHTFILDSSDANYKGLQFNTIGKTRWFLYTDPNSETGSNTGSDIRFARYADDGTYLGNIFSVNRKTGDFRFNDNISTNSYYTCKEWALAYERSNSWNANPTFNDVILNGATTWGLPIFNRASGQKFVLKSQANLGDNYFSFQDANGLESAYQGFGSTTNEDYTFFLKRSGLNRFQWYIDGWIMYMDANKVDIWKPLYVNAQIDTLAHGNSKQWNDAYQKVQTIDDDFLPKSYASTSAIAVSYLSSGIPPANSRLKIKLPYFTYDGKMLAFTVRVYTSYTHYDIVCSGYLYSTANQWYLPSAKMTVAHGNNPNYQIDVVFGRDNDGLAYVSIPRDAYMGVAVLDVVGGYNSGEYGKGWEIIEDSSIPNYEAIINVRALTDLSQLNNDSNFVNQTYVDNKFASVPVHNGQLTVNTTADLVGGYVYLPSGNVTTTLGLATHILNAIADGQTAYSYGNHATQGYLKIADLAPYETTVSVNNKLTAKQDKIIAGANVSIVGNTISATDTDTVTRIGVWGGNYTSGDINFTATGAATIVKNGNNVNIDVTNSGGVPNFGVEVLDFTPGSYSIDTNLSTTIVRCTAGGSMYSFDVKKGKYDGDELCFTSCGYEYQVHGEILTVCSTGLTGGSNSTRFIWADQLNIWVQVSP